MTLRAFPFQDEILDKLAAERAIHGRRRNLVVAATGTGKTVIAAFDYQRQCAKTGVAPRLLFLAHREELLDQARRTFRYVLQDASFGEVLAGGSKPRSDEHLFATIQSAASTGLLDRLGADYYRHVIVDECHHMLAASYQAIARELDELREVLSDRVNLAGQILPVPEWSLALHRHYSRREIAAAVGYVAAGAKNISLQGGILKLEGQRELLFVTLDKSGKAFSPTTRYRDYAISPELFHWETQAAASVMRPSGRRYIDSATNGYSFFLFVRTDPESAFAFLGPVRYEAHTGDRPIAITWRLTTPMPAVLYERYATLRSG